MTRKDFELIARSMRETRPLAYISRDSKEYRAELKQWCDMREKLATELQYDNPNFDRERFVAACNGV